MRPWRMRGNETERREVAQRKGDERKHPRNKSERWGRSVGKYNEVIKKNNK